MHESAGDNFHHIDHVDSTHDIHFDELLAETEQQSSSSVLDEHSAPFIQTEHNFSLDNIQIKLELEDEGGANQSSRYIHIEYITNFYTVKIKNETTDTQTQFLSYSSEIQRDNTLEGTEAVSRSIIGDQNCSESITVHQPTHKMFRSNASKCLSMQTHFPASVEVESIPDC